MGENKKFKFDVIIGNPPYQEDDGGASASASPIYQYFVTAAKEVNPDRIVMITPSRWFVGGKGLDEYRNAMLNDRHIELLCDWLTPQDVFPDTNIRGGVSFFIWNKEYDNQLSQARVITCKDNKVVSDVKRCIKFDDVDIFIRDYWGLKIVEKIKGKLDIDTLANHISSRKPFGLSTTFDKTAAFRKDKSGLHNPILCYTKGQQKGFIEEDDVVMHSDWINQWKLFTTRANNIGTELNDDNLNTIIGAPNTVCTETYLVVGADMNLTLEKVKNLQSYMKTKFVRFLHGLSKGSQDATAKTYRFIPVENFDNSSDIDWKKSISEIDDMLFKKYNLTQQEIDHINNSVKEMA